MNTESNGHINYYLVRAALSITLQVLFFKVILLVKLTALWDGQLIKEM